MAPLLRRMAQQSKLDLSVAYCTLRGAQAAHDPDFNTTVQWDIPLLEGYSWQEVPNQGSGAGSFWGLYHPGLWKLIRKGRFDAVLCYLSYLCAFFWISFSACRLSGTAFLFGTDASNLVPRSGSTSKMLLKSAFWPRLHSLADQVFVPSSATRDLMLSLGLPTDRITLTPYSVDNDWWMAQSKAVDRNAVRAGWRASPQTCVILFCAKLQPWKRPLDLLHAFTRTNLANALLVYAGEGTQRRELEREASRLGVKERVRFLGFLNQTQLPPVYTAADLMVLPSEYEPFAVVVNEASCCGCAVVASDRVGSVRDLIMPVDPGLVYPCGNVEALSALLVKLNGDREHLRRDEPLAMVIRSRRFRPLLPLMKSTFSRVLRGARSVDVTSTMMRDYFKMKYGVDCFALYKFLPELPIVNFHRSSEMLTVGHIGSLYHPDPFRDFIRACRSYAAAQNRFLKIVRIGTSQEIDKIASENLATFENHRELLEQDALPVLATCDFVYAMYPAGFQFQGFRRTSLPIKLSTYIQAQRPIFAHTPPDSGLAQLISQYGVGTVCSSNRESDIQRAVQATLDAKINRDNFETIRNDLMGPRSGKPSPIPALRNAHNKERLDFLFRDIDGTNDKRKSKISSLRYSVRPCASPVM